MRVSLKDDTIPTPSDLELYPSADDDSCKVRQMLNQSCWKLGMQGRWIDLTTDKVLVRVVPFLTGEYLNLDVLSISILKWFVVNSSVVKVCHTRGASSVCSSPRASGCIDLGGRR